MLYGLVQQLPLWQSIVGAGVVIIGYVLLTNKENINQNYRRTVLYYKWTLIVNTVLSVALMPLLTALFFLLWLYRGYINFRLRKKYGGAFAGLLDGTDAIWALEDRSLAIINVLIIVKHPNKENFEEAFKAFVKSKILANRQNSLKLFYSLEKSEPYFFFLKDQLDIEDCFHRIEIDSKGSQKISPDDMRKYLSKLDGKKLPKGHKALWEVYIGCQKIAWHTGKNEESDDESLYPVIFRFHHSLLDGSTFLKFFVSFLGENEILQHGNGKRKQNGIVDNSSTLKDFSTIPNKFLRNLNIDYFLCRAGNILKDLRQVIWFLPTVTMMSSIKNDKISFPTSRSLSVSPNDKKIAWYSEATPKYLGMIKEIKSKIGEATFTDVMFAAISNSLVNFFAKHSKSVPEYMYCAFPIIARIPELQHITPGKYDVEEVVFQNRFTIGITDILVPTTTKDLNSKEVAINTLVQINENSLNAKNPVELRTNYWIMAFLGKYVPPFLLQKILDLLPNITVCMSNLKGPKTLKFSNDMVLKDIVFWIPRVLGVGIGFSVLTYEGRLQMGLNISRSLLPSPEDLQALLEDTVKTLDILHKTVTSSNT